jgi:predicted enzyme related to lactoylglutathione lyase
MTAPIVEWQILATEPDRVAAFYADLFRWTVDAGNPLAYRRVHIDGQPSLAGGIWPAPPEARSFVQLFVGVDDVRRYFERACELGATALIPPQTLPDGDELAIVKDPFGMSFGIRSLPKNPG